MPEAIRLLVIGSGLLFERARAQWPAAVPSREFDFLEIAVDEAAAFDPARLGDFPPERTRVFAAIDAIALNFGRLDLYTRLRLMGYRAESFVHPAAYADPSAKFGENCYVGEGAIVGAQAVIGHNCFVGPGARLGFRAEIHSSCWIEAGVICGDGARVGAHTILGAGVTVAASVAIGSYCDLERPAHYAEPVADRTYIHSLFDRPVRIISA